MLKFMEGWTPREVLSTFAMVGILASDSECNLDADSIANQAFEVADAMLAVQSREKQELPKGE